MAAAKNTTTRVSYFGSGLKRTDKKDPFLEELQKDMEAKKVSACSKSLSGLIR